MATSSESESLSEITIQNLKNRELFQWVAENFDESISSKFQGKFVECFGAKIIHTRLIKVVPHFIF